MTTAPATQALPYTSFHAASEQLAHIEAIDYYLARDITCHSAERLSAEQISLCFHLVIAVSTALRDGHVCLPISELANQQMGYLSDNEGLVTHQGFHFSDAQQINELIEQLQWQEQTGLIIAWQGKLYLRRYFLFEQELAKNLRARALTNQDFNHQQITSVIEQIFPSESAAEIDWQKLSVINALNKQLAVIAGGPGTGKTYTVTKLLAAMVMLNNNFATNRPLKMALSAPTGKAAQRLTESIQQAVTNFRGQIDDEVLDGISAQAQTIHRLLGVIPSSPNFKHDQNNKIAIDFLLIDEVSMVDLPLMTRLFRALPEHTKVVMLGDADQLPSVAVGSVLADIAPRPLPGYSKSNVDYLAACYPELKSNSSALAEIAATKNKAADYLTFLVKSRRFDGEGGIGLLAKAVIASNAEQSWQLLAQANKSESQLTLLDQSIEKWLPAMVAQYFQPIAKAQSIEQAFSLFARFRILCASRQGETGIEQLNADVQGLLGVYHQNPHNPQQNLYHGQPIMIQENDYRLGLFNGDIGMVWRNTEGQLLVAFEGDNGQIIWHIPARLPAFEMVYAMTIHKTQGSEFEHVAMVLPNSHDNKLLSRELLYTGITRAKQQLSICTQANIWHYGVNEKVTRYSGFAM